MIKVQVGTNADGSPRVFTLSWISAVALQGELERELRFDELRWKNEVAAMHAREEKRRGKKSR